MSRALNIYRAASKVASRVPTRTLLSSARFGGRLAARARPEIGSGLEANLSVVAASLETKDLMIKGIGSYARYWAEMFRIPELDPTVIDRGFSFSGLENLWDVRQSGQGPIVLLPHLGGWEWAAAWLAKVEKVPVTAAVERLEPEDLFDWFVRLRESYGVNVVPVGSDSFSRLAKAVRAGHIVCLVGDRDISDNGVKVEMFGRTAKFPVGPAMLSIRTGSPIVVTSVAFRSHDRICRLGKPMYARPDGKLRDRAAELTQRYADSFAELISEAPEQWHVLSPVFEPEA